MTFRIRPHAYRAHQARQDRFMQNAAFVGFIAGLCVAIVPAFVFIILLMSVLI